MILLIALLCGPVQCTRIPDQAFPTPTACEAARQEERGRRVEGLRVEGYFPPTKVAGAPP